MSSPPAKVRPSGFWYLLPLLLVIGGSVLAIVVIVSGVQSYSDTIEGFARVPVGQTGTVQIDGTGGYTIFYEPGTSDTDTLAESDPQPPIVMTDPNGQPVQFEDYSGLATYSSSGYVGFAIQTFQVDEPGAYVLTVNEPVLGGTVAVGRSPFKKITRGVLGGLAIGFGGFVAALVVLIILMVSRGRSKRRRGAASYAQYPQQQGWTPTPAPAGYQQYPQYPPTPTAPPAAPPAAAPSFPPSGGFGPPPGSAGPPPGAPGPPSAPPPQPPPDTPDDTAPGWGQPGR